VSLFILNYRKFHLEPDFSTVAEFFGHEMPTNLCNVGLRDHEWATDVRLLCAIFNTDCINFVVLRLI